MTLALLIISLLLGFAFELADDKDVAPFVTSAVINQQWYIVLLCYKLRFVLLTLALSINLKGIKRMAANIFLCFYGLNLVEYLIMYNSLNSGISFAIKVVVSLLLIILFDYGKRSNNSTLAV